MIPLLSEVSPVWRAPLRPVVRLARGLPVWTRAQILQRQPGPTLVFLPATGRSGAALLRSYLLAEALESLGWHCLVLPPSLTLAQRHRLIEAVQPAALMMQGARHALNQPSLYAGMPVIFDMDDADFHLPHLADRVRRAMPDVTCVTAGSRYVATWCLGAGALRAKVVWTGAPCASPQAPAQRDRHAPVVVWAQTRPMDYHFEASVVRRVMTKVAKRRAGGVRLRLYDRRSGDDPGFAQTFAAPGLTVEWRTAMRYDPYLQSFDDAAVGLAPLCAENLFSAGKSFGKVLGYLDRRVPIVGSDAGEHGAFFTPETGVITNDEAQWVTSILKLLDDHEARQRLSETAYSGFQARLTTRAMARRVVAVLGELGLRDKPRQAV